tara:strand:+ start:906 stop:1160 length:255 start_codon:yes stop_codon:yes gene_type:complete
MRRRPETVSVRIREDDYAAIKSIANDAGMKVPDTVTAILEHWKSMPENQRNSVLGLATRDDNPVRIEYDLHGRPIPIRPDGPYK